MLMFAFVYTFIFWIYLPHMNLPHPDSQTTTLAAVVSTLSFHSPSALVGEPLLPSKPEMCLGYFCSECPLMF
jgi:hypothetical protein